METAKSLKIKFSTMDTTTLKKMELELIEAPIETNSEEKLLQLVQNQDIVAVEQLLDENLVKDKFHLLHALQKEYTEFQNGGDTALSYCEGKCNFCYCGKTAHLFFGNQSGRKMAIVIEKNEADEISDFTLCGSSSGK
jgi:hypothetical protein